ncbi:MAG: HAD family hydrolase [Spirochaetales bacterium]|nr:HAD family hydrolase [Spirochaetales bacterium]
MEIKGIGFDIDGTLYSNCFMYLCTIPSFIKHPRLVWHFGRVRADIREIRPVENYRRLQAGLIAGSIGRPEIEIRARVEKHLYEDWEKSFRIIKPFSGIGEGLLELRSKGYKLGVMSDFPVQNKLKYLGLEDWDCSFTSESTGYLKPHPEPFLELARRMGLSPEEILYVGNSYSKDIIGAADVGMKTAHFAPSVRAGSIADFTFRKYPDLFKYILNKD